MDKSKMSVEEVFKLESNEIAESLGNDKPFDEDGNLVKKSVEKKTSKKSDKKEDTKTDKKEDK